ncbi:MAG: sodium:solute symporter family protein [Ignavibacteria bacterium]|jgi:SSS family solute:Na+ symporter|nr:sodium:solute symporter family protein [Ignavibacteria bacterium]
MTLNSIDILLIAVYFALILYIGFVIAKRKKNESSLEDFILAGRKLTLPIFVATLVATWYGSILGVGEFAYNDGIVAWLCFSLPYYLAGAIFGAFFAKKIRISNVKTIPELITNNYGNKAGRISSVIVLIITIPASYLLMLGVIVQIFSGWDLWICVIFGAIVSLSYLYTGGFKADVLTNTAQFFLMYIGFAALLFYAMSSFGGLGEMLSNLPETHKSAPGNHSWQYILMWYIIAFQTFIDPSFHQRAAAAKTAKTAQRGVLISVLCWLLFDTLTILCALYARAYIDISDPIMTYPLLAEQILPHFWKGIFLIALLAAIMSTLDSYSFISSVTIGNDLLHPFFKKRNIFQHLSVQKLTQIGLVITAVFSIIGAVILPSVIDLIYKTASIAIPGLIIPVLLTFTKKYRISGKKIVQMILLSSSTSFFWIILAIFSKKTSIFVTLEPMLPGLFVSILFAVFFIRKNEMA